MNLLLIFFGINYLCVKTAKFGVNTLGVIDFFFGFLAFGE
jgi:hypothetical protein